LMLPGFVVSVDPEQKRTAACACDDVIRTRSHTPPRKATSNWEKHGVPFDDAVSRAVVPL